MAIHRTGYAVNTGRRTPLGHGKRRAHGRSRPPVFRLMATVRTNHHRHFVHMGFSCFCGFADMTKGHEATLINKNKVRNTLMLSKIWLGLSYK